MPKPSEFYIGLMEFFSILLPGALLTAALIVQWEPQGQEGIARLLAVPGANWIAFALVAYALGHFAYLAAASIDSPLYDRYREWRWPERDDCCYVRATAALKAFFGTAQGKDVPMNTFAWAKSVLQLKAPAALADVERYEADSKFFRSLIVVLPIAGPLLADTPRVAILPALAVALISFLCYAARRHKSTEWAYRYLLVLIEAPSPDLRR
jgi:hypothetical protein